MKRYHDLRKQNERLEEFTGIVAHDLRNPLADATGFTEMAIEQTAGEVREFLERAKRSLDRMDALVGECLVLAKEGTDIGQREEVDVATTARNAWESVTTEDASLALDVEGTVYADPQRLTRVFENPFRNAVEHCHSGVSVTVSGRPDSFAVSGDGPGLPPAVIEALTESDVENIKQLGLGLRIVERIVSGHGWDLRVETSTDGTTFEMVGVNTAAPTHREHAGTGT